MIRNIEESQTKHEEGLGDARDQNRTFDPGGDPNNSGSSLTRVPRAACTKTDAPVSYELCFGCSRYG